MHLTPLAWYWPLIGGGLIGLAAGGYLLVVGRVAGISGLLAASLGLQPGGARRLSVLFVLGLLCAGGLAVAVKPIALPALASVNLPQLVLAGLLVGYGSRLGSGCTSGHGVCGLARLSPRSLVATAVFMAAGMASASLVRMIAGGGA